MNNQNDRKLENQNNSDLYNLVLIDYEYGGYNYKGFDLGNFMNECLFDYNESEAPYFKYIP